MFTLLHTNDFHNQLTQEQSDKLCAHRSDAGESVLLLDAGDAIGAGNITYRSAGEPILDMMNRIGYDAMTVGNREFHFSLRGFQRKLCRAAFPVLCANVRKSGNKVCGNNRFEILHMDPPVLSYIVRDFTSGWRIVVFGITVPMITEQMPVRIFSPYVFDEPIQIAAQLVPQLRSQFSPDLLIGLTHIGIEQDRVLAAQVSGIDLIVGGHTHVALKDGERVGETLIVQAGCKGQYMGRVTAIKTGQGISMTASLEAL